MGYLRYPSISGDTIFFCSEDDLWSVPADGGRAWRLTAGVAAASGPVPSPNGETLAFVGEDDGPTEIYTMPADGGDSRRLTFDGARCSVVGWSDDGERVIFGSNAGRPFGGDTRLFTVPAAGGQPAMLPYGMASVVAHGPDGQVVLARRAGDPARWKRYRGGTAGKLWIDREASGEFEPLIELAGNLAGPAFVAGRIYFLSDHEGFGNVYSCTTDGDDLRRHTDHTDFYARNLRSDGNRLVYHCAGDVWLLEPGPEPGAEPDEARPVSIDTGSTRSQRARQFVSGSGFLESAAFGPDGSDLAVTARGKPFSLGLWEGPVDQHGTPDGVRYRLLRWLADHRRLIAAASDEAPEERLVVLTADGSASPRELDLDLGRAVAVEPAPVGSKVAVTNHRGDLMLLDLDEPDPTGRRLDHSDSGDIGRPAWSPDGRWVAYARPDTPDVSTIRLCRVADGHTWPVTEPALRDSCPAFDPEGKYLYFLSTRECKPIRDQVHFELSFPMAVRPYLVTLREDVRSPFVREPEPVVAADKPKTDNAGQFERAEKSDADEDTEDKGGDGPAPVEIDVDGLADRVLGFDLPDDRYVQIAGIAGKVLFTTQPIRTDSVPFGAKRTDLGADLKMYEFSTGTTETIAGDVAEFNLDPSCKTMLYRTGSDRLRVLKAGAKPEGNGDAPSRKSGWIDLDRVRIPVTPGAEWGQMFRESWRKLRDHFWAEDMSQILWDEVYDRYRPLVAQVASRAELSDLLWELIGELGTSHCYEFGGDYRPTPQYPQGFLGVDWEVDTDGRYRIGRVLRGDPWRRGGTSALNRPGTGVAAGDTVVAINGRPIGRTEDGWRSPGEALVDTADREVRLTVVRDGGSPPENDGDGSDPRTVVVGALDDERQIRYRDWVNRNAELVADRTDGRVGYLHVPNMVEVGFAEFHRTYLAVYDAEGLIIDVRFNGGGNVSMLLLEKLARRRVGAVAPRWWPAGPYPYQAPRGPMVALTNAEAGSDGDIFSHCFKLYGLGPLVGTRTWGGVVGMCRMERLSDGTVTSQPEVAFAFDDVGWGVENHGTDPDVEVEIRPQDYAAGVDPQLDAAIEQVLNEIKIRGRAPASLPPRPSKAAPVLPPRPHLGA